LEQNRDDHYIGVARRFSSVDTKMDENIDTDTPLLQLKVVNFSIKARRDFVAFEIQKLFEID